MARARENWECITTKQLEQERGGDNAEGTE